MDTYEYKWNEKPRTTTILLMTLVDAQDPRQYCQAQLKKNSKNEKMFEEAVRKYKDGTRFEMSRVGFADDAKLAFVSCSLKIVVDISKTKMDPSDGASDSAVQPAPTASVAGSSSLGTNQYFDLTALIQKVGETSQHDNNRFSLVVMIHDGSEDKDIRKVKAMPLRL